MAAKLITEFIGTFFLVFTIACIGLNPQIGAFAPIAIAGTLMVMIYAGGHVSGAHYNPAVTIAAWLRGACPKSDVAPYIIVQLVAGLLGAATTLVFGLEPQATEPFDTLLSVFIGELIFTFALCYVVLNVATTEKLQGNSFYGLAIAGTVLAGAYSVGGVTGGVFNPSVAVSGLILGFTNLQILPVYLIAQAAAAVIAAFVYRQIAKGA